MMHFVRISIQEQLITEHLITEKYKWFLKPKHIKREKWNDLLLDFISKEMIS